MFVGELKTGSFHVFRAIPEIYLHFGYRWDGSPTRPLPGTPGKRANSLWPAFVVVG